MTRLATRFRSPPAVPSADWTLYSMLATTSTWSPALAIPSRSCSAVPGTSIARTLPEIFASTPVCVAGRNARSLTCEPE